MATTTMDERFTLNEKELDQIIATPRTKIPEVNIFNDIKLPKKERIAHAANILKNRKCKS
ncbi:hypothetical protein [Peribacillus frigoritolerans]|uniref:hypothetical protein n=1 Tax=Peribacillus frigoritolerans TaxID=450367 RepID=UPI002E1CE9DF|nr:hypothetical protein [Peribacillus frigoritolerans]